MVHSSYLLQIKLNLQNFIYLFPEIESTKIVTVAKLKFFKFEIQFLRSKKRQDFTERQSINEGLFIK
jgi:hypothetical protein